ncbi:MAG: helix-turn-helix domain-containing protein [Lachnospiraceae bacterium]
MKEQVKQLRTELNLTLEKFGEKLGVTKQTISRIENGVNNLTDQMFTAICNVNWDGKYVNEEWLRTGEGEMFKENSDDELKLLAEKYKMSDMEYTFLKEYFKLPKNCRETFFETLDTMFSAIYKNASPAFSDISATSEQPEKTLEELSDDEKVELYRQELKREREVTEKLRALQKSG